MKIEISMPTEFIESLYDILIEARNTRTSKRTEAVEKIDNLNTSDTKRQLSHIQNWTEEITLLDIATDNIADELKKEGAI